MIDISHGLMVSCCALSVCGFPHIGCIDGKLLTLYPQLHLSHLIATSHVSAHRADVDVPLLLFF